MSELTHHFRGEKIVPRERALVLAQAAHSLGNVRVHVLANEGEAVQLKRKQINGRSVKPIVSDPRVRAVPEGHVALRVEGELDRRGLGPLYERVHEHQAQLDVTPPVAAANSSQVEPPVA